jgi:hypothetical protein
MQTRTQGRLHMNEHLGRNQGNVSTTKECQRLSESYQKLQILPHRPQKDTSLDIFILDYSSTEP